MIHFVDELANIDKKLPLCTDGDLISISFNIFNAFVSEADPLGLEGIERLERYFKELTYCYASLVSNTNILDCGRVRIFVDTRIHKYAVEYLSKTGLDQLIEWITLPIGGVRFTGYIPMFEDESVLNCRYRFYTSADRWWLNMQDEPFDFIKFCDKLDTYSDTCIFGRDATGHLSNNALLLKSGDFCLPITTHTDEDIIRRTAEMHFDKMFQGNIPNIFKQVLEGGDNSLDLPYLAGHIVGVRKDSEMSRILHKEYTRHGSSDGCADDEAFIVNLLYRYPQLQICNIFYPIEHAVDGLIKDTYFVDGFPNSGNNIDVAPGDFSKLKDLPSVPILLDYFRNIFDFD